MIELIENSETGNLIIKVTNLKEFIEWVHHCRVDDERGKLNMLLDDTRYIGNDWHTPTEIGLTEAPAIAYGAMYDDEDEMPSDYEKLWYYDAYMIYSFIDVLTIESEVEFKLAK